MKNTTLYTIFSFIFIMLMLPHAVTGQEKNDSIIMAAMRDELHRNMAFLTSDEMDPPFFIAYSLADAKISYAGATLGALSSSGEQSYKDWNVRVMVGDYRLNDENFSASQPGNMAFEGSVDMPIDADYYGIRRSLWLTTNRVYNSAARTYKNKLSLINHQKLDSTVIDIPDFSYAPVVKIKETSVPLNYPKEQLEDLSRTLSAEFKGISEIQASNVNASVFESTIFFINSEGTEVQYPFIVTTLSVSASTMTDDSERITQSLSYAAKTPGDLPQVDEIKQDIRTLINYIKQLRAAPRFGDEYTGPVLYLGDEVPKIFGKVLFGGNDNLIASREELHSNSQMNMYYAKNTNGFESKIDKLVISKEFTITAEAQKKVYDGIPLFGSFNVDAEGVVPPDSIVLIKDGILHNLLNGRTPSRNTLASNGHMRFSYTYSGLNTQVGPGVIRIESEGGETIEELRSKLLEKARESGLEYAIVIRPLETMSTAKPKIISKIWLESGEEELIRMAQVSDPDTRNLRHPLGFSNQPIVLNTLWSGNGEGGSTGIPVSFIAPDGLLLDDIELSSLRKSLTNMVPVVPNPAGLTTESSKSASQSY